MNALEAERDTGVDEQSSGATLIPFGSSFPGLKVAMALSFMMLITGRVV